MGTFGNCDDWNNPAARHALLETIGPEAYNRALRAHHEASAVCTVNGYRIRPVGTRFGRLFAVDGTSKAFSTLVEAEHYARILQTA